MPITLNIPQAHRKDWFHILSWIMSHVMLVAAVIALGSAIIPALSLKEGVNLTVNGAPFFSEDQIPNTYLRVLSIASFAIVALVQAWGFFGLRRTFQQSAKNMVFSDASVRGFRRFAYATLFVIFAQGFSDSLMEGVTNFVTHGQMGIFHMDVAFPETTELLYAFLFLFVAHAFVIGERVQVENDTFL